MFNIKCFPLAEPVCQCDSEQCLKLVGASDEVCTAKDPGAKYKCGSCECDQNEGPSCQCTKGGDGGEDERKKCKANEGDSQECSGHGVCKCGACLCHPDWVEPHCACPKAGIDCGHGKHFCSDGGETQCRCNDGWKMDGAGKCSCSLEDKSACRPPQPDGGGWAVDYCSGPDRGNCECNECVCKDGFKGKFCQQEKNSKERTCESMAPCILLDIYGRNETILEKHKEVSCEL